MRIKSCTRRPALATGALLASLSLSAFAQSPNPNLGRDLAAACANCHGTNGVTKSEMPMLAGKPADQIIQLFREFRDGKRPATIMHQISKGYTEKQVRLLCEWYLRVRKSS